MTGKLKTKGNMMLATKLDSLLKVRSFVALTLYMRSINLLFLPSPQNPRPSCEVFRPIAAGIT